MRITEIQARLYYPEGTSKVPPIVQATDYRSEGGKINVQVRVVGGHKQSEDMLFFTAERWEQVDKFARAYEMLDDVGMRDAGLKFLSSTRIR